MNKLEQKAFQKSVYPVGEKRWLEVEYTDTDKASATINTSANQEEFSEKFGFKVTKITIRPEFEPQVSAIVELRNEVIEYLTMAMGHNEIVETTAYKFSSKIEEVINKTVVSHE